MNNKPKVSIIIPVYNGGNYLRGCINSALLQTYDNKEIIVVNDGSCDNGETEMIALEYGNKIRYYSKSNGGVSSALNYGISVMEGEWFSWLSHDDLYLPTKISAQIEYLNTKLKSNNSIEKCVLYCDTEFIDDKGNVILRLKPIAKENERTKEIILKNLKKNRLGGCSFLVPKVAFKEIGRFNERIKTVSDYDFWYRLLLGGYKFLYIPQILVQGRMHRQQITYRMSEVGYKEFNDFHIWLLNTLDKHFAYDDYSVYLKIACYSIQRGYGDSAQIALGMARKRINPIVYWTGYFWCVAYGNIYRLVKKIAKSVFANLRVK